MKKIIKNPFTVWLVRYIKARSIERGNRGKQLDIGYMSTVTCCSFGHNNKIHDYVALSNVSMGDYSYVASGTIISNAIVGKFCSIGPSCKVGLGMHPTRKYVTTHPMFYSLPSQRGESFADKQYFEEYKKIMIDNDVWLGSNVIVTSGVRIGDGAIVGAGAVVTKDVPPYAIVAGVPAKLIRYRFDKNIIELLLLDKWWNKHVDDLRKNYKDYHDINRYISIIK